jgi:hypothetical protein
MQIIFHKKGSFMKKITTMEIMLILSLLLALGANGAKAGSLCLGEATRKLRPDQEIIVVGYDTTSIRGRLVQIDFNRSAITISRLLVNDVIDTTIGVDHIAGIKYRHARLRPGYMLLGTIAGPMLVGIVVGGGSHSSDWENLEKGVAIVLGGMGGGLLMGTVLPLIFPGHDTIHCDN